MVEFSLLPNYQNYSNGCITTAPDSTMNKIDYPKNWLKEVGYFDGPVGY